MKWLLDANGNVVMRNGMPVMVYPDGKEVEVDAPKLFQKVTELNGESKGWREKFEAANTTITKLGDKKPEDLLAMLQEIEGLGGMDKVKAGSKVDIEALKTSISKVYEEKLGASSKALEESNNKIYKLLVGNKFASSEVLKKSTLLPDIAEAYFGGNFKVDGEEVAGYLKGNRIFSRTKPGEFADFEESLEQMIEAHPQKDSLWKGTGHSGSGAEGGERGGNGKTIKAGDSDAFGLNIEAIANGTVTVV